MKNKDVLVIGNSEPMVLDCLQKALQRIFYGLVLLSPNEAHEFAIKFATIEGSKKLAKTFLEMEYSVGGK